jgi:hypothetical protein
MDKYQSRCKGHEYRNRLCYEPAAQRPFRSELEQEIESFKTFLNLPPSSIDDTHMDLSLEIRPFTPSDQTGVVQLWGEVFPNDPPWNDPAELIRRKLSVQPELFFVAHGNGRILGTVLAGFDGVRGWIYHLAVRP